MQVQHDNSDLAMMDHDELVDRAEPHAREIRIPPCRDIRLRFAGGQFPDDGDIVDLFRNHPGERVSAAELNRYRYHHARLGYSFTRNWMLPDALRLSILHHHDFGMLGDDLPDCGTVNHKRIAFGLLADQVLALRAGDGLCPDWAPHEQFVLATLRLRPEDIVALVAQEEGLAEA